MSVLYIIQHTNSRVQQTKLGYASYKIGFVMFIKIRSTSNQVADENLKRKNDWLRMKNGILTFPWKCLMILYNVVKLG